MYPGWRLLFGLVSNSQWAAGQLRSSEKLGWQVRALSAFHVAPFFDVLSYSSNVYTLYFYKCMKIAINSSCSISYSYTLFRD